MEDALVLPLFFTLLGLSLSLNPCFNGRCTRTRPIDPELSEEIISLNPCFNGRCTRTYW